MQAILAVSNFLAVERPLLPEATRLILQNAHTQAATCIFDASLGTFESFLQVNVPFANALGYQNRFIKLSIGEWLDFFNVDGSLSPTIGDFLKAAGLPPLTQTSLVPNLPPSSSPASLQLFFSSQEQYQAFQQILPCCHTAKQGHHCLQVPAAGGPFCPTHSSLLALLTAGNTSPDSDIIVSPVMYYQILLPTAELFAAARPTLSIGKSSSDRLRLQLARAITPIVSKAKTLSSPYEKLVVLPDSGALSPEDTLPVFVPVALGHSVENSVSTILQNEAFQHGHRHFSQAVWPSVKLLSSAAFLIGWPAPGTVAREISMANGLVGSVSPLLPFFLKYSPAAFPCFANLFGHSSSEPTWCENYLKIAPHLGIPCGASSGSIPNFLLCLQSWRQAFVHSRIFAQQKLRSFSELIFHAWAADNCSSELRDIIVSQGLHLHFTPIQWVLACTDAIINQAVEVLTPLSAFDDAVSYTLQMSFLQAFRNLCSNPGILSPVEVKEPKGTFMANIGSLDSKSPMFAFDPLILTPAELYRARVEAATMHLISRSPRNIPTEDQASAAKTYASSIPSLLAGLRSPKTAPHSPPKADKKRSPTKDPSTGADPKKLKWEVPSAAPSPPPAATVSPQREARTVVDNTTWMDRFGASLMARATAVLPTAQALAYNKSFLTQAKYFVPIPGENITSAHVTGWKVIPLYRVFPHYRRNTEYCCACGSHKSHEAETCPLLLNASAQPSDIPQVRFSLHGARN